MTVDCPWCDTAIDLFTAARKRGNGKTLRCPSCTNWCRMTGGRTDDPLIRATEPRASLLRRVEAGDADAVTELRRRMGPSPQQRDLMQARAAARLADRRAARQDRHNAEALVNPPIGRMRKP